MHRAFKTLIELEFVNCPAVATSGGAHAVSYLCPHLAGNPSNQRSEQGFVPPILDEEIDDGGVIHQ